MPNPGTHSVGGDNNVALSYNIFDLPKYAYFPCCFWFFLFTVLFFFCSTLLANFRLRWWNFSWMQIQWKIPPACWPAFQAGSARNSSLSTVPHKYTIYINEYLIKAQRCTERTAGQVNSNRVHLPPLNCDIPEVAIVLYTFNLQKAPDINCVVGGA